MSADVVIYPNTIAIVYVVEGVRHAADVAAGKGALVSAVVGSPDGSVRVISQDIPAVLQQYFGRSRIYLDAVFARCIERRFHLPGGPYCDLRTMRALVARASGQSVQQIEWERPQPASTPLASVANIAPLVREIRLAEAWQAVLRAKQADVYSRVELPAIEPTCSMILSGIRVDHAKLAELRVDVEPPVIIRQLAGREVDLKDDEDLRRLLVELNLPMIDHREARQPSVSIDSLELMCHPIVPHLIEWRRKERLRAAAERLWEHLAGSDRVYGCLDPLGCETGRFSCRDFALQGLPRGIRQVLVPDAGEVFVEADIDQCELRILAYLAQDPVMLGAFQRGEDLHRLTASMVLGRPAESISLVDRARVGKPLNFGMVYGISARGLAEQLGVDQATALSWIDSYFAAFPGVAAWKHRVVDAKRRFGYAETLSGRRRHIDEPGASGDRKAINSTVQGTAADLLKLRLPQLPPQYRLVMTNHDSVLLAVPASRAAEAKQLVRQVMSHCQEWLMLPLSVTASEGATWGDCGRDSDG